MKKSVVSHRLGLQLNKALNTSISEDGNSPRLSSRRSSLASFMTSFSNLRKITQGSRLGPKSEGSSQYGKSLCRGAHRRFKNAQKIVYLLLEDPSSSIIAKMLFMVIVLGILFTTFNSFVASALQGEENPAVAGVEFSISVLFIGEYMLRLFSATAFGENFFRVMFKLFNLIDLIALAPFFIEVALEDKESAQLNSLRMIRIIRLVKVLRFLKIGRYMKGTEVFYQGVKASVSSFGFLALLLLIVDLVFATLYFYAEQHPIFEEISDDEEHRVSNFADAMWWALTTMTTVGYGDRYPSTILGKIVASAVSVCGMLLISLPIALLGNNFQSTFSRHSEEDRVAAYKESKFHAEDKQSLSNSEREVHFMKERIRSIESTNKQIIKILQGSEQDYKEVAKKLALLYESIYLEEEALAKKSQKDKNPEVKLSPFLKMDDRIQMYEKLNRAKKKINLAHIFRKKTTVKAEDESPLLTQREVAHENQSEEQKSPNLPRSRSIKGAANLPLKGKIKTMISGIDNDHGVQSEIIETVGDSYPQLVPHLDPRINFNNMNLYKSNLLEHTIYSKENTSSPDPTHFKVKESQTLIKSHSMDNINSFLQYYVENLSFMNMGMLDVLLQSESDDANESTPMHLKRGSSQRRRSFSGAIKQPVPLDEAQRAERKNKKTIVIDMTKTGAVVEKDYDKKLWLLSGKILEKMEQKSKLQQRSRAEPQAVLKDNINGEDIDNAIRNAKKEIAHLLSLKEQLNRKQKGPNTLDFTSNIEFDQGLSVEASQNRKVLKFRPGVFGAIDEIEEGTLNKSPQKAAKAEMLRTKSKKNFIDCLIEEDWSA